MTMKNIAMVLVLSLLTTGFSAGLSAHEKKEGKAKHGMKRAHGEMKFMKRAFSKLNLTKEQKASLKALKKDNKASNMQVKEQVMDLKLQLKQQLNADSIDEIAVKSLSAQIADIKSTQAIKMAKFKKEALAILTDEQRAKFDAMKQKRINKIKKRLDAE